MRKIKKVFKAGSLGVCLIFFSLFSQAKQMTIERNSTGGYTFFVKGRPFLIKGIIYNPTPIGSGYDYDLFSDPTKPWIFDGKLMKEAGINTVRIYSCRGADLRKVKKFIREL